MEITFLGGVHGVGKSHLAARLGPAIGAEHLTAGTIIRGASAIGPKEVADVDAAQELLIRGLEKLAAESHGPVLLDGHYCLLAPGGDIQPIPIAVFKRIAPRRLLVLLDDPEAIAARLSARDLSVWNASNLRTFQDKEAAHAAVVSTALGLRLQSLRATEWSTFDAQRASELLRE